MEVPFSVELDRQYASKCEAVIASQAAEHSARVTRNAERAISRTAECIEAYTRFFSNIQTKKTSSIQTKSLYIPPQSQLLVVIRIRGMNRVPPKARKALDLLRLRRVNSCIFMRNTPEITGQLQLIRNYVAYGVPDLSLLRELVYKRGMTTLVRKNAFGEQEKKIANITNEIIEDVFGDFVCLEDLVHGLFFGIRFTEINRFLNPFRLNSPKTGFKGKKSKDVVEGGSCGNWGEEIGNLIKKMID